MSHIRLLFLAACLILLALALRYERHTVHRFAEPDPQNLTGPAFVNGATVDSYLLRESQLFDVYSLSKATAGIKDCAT